MNYDRPKTDATEILFYLIFKHRDIDRTKVDFCYLKPDDFNNRLFKDIYSGILNVIGKGERMNFENVVAGGEFKTHFNIDSLKRFIRLGEEKADKNKTDIIGYIAELQKIIKDGVK